MNKFEQLSCNGHQMTLAWVPCSHIPEGSGLGGPPVSWLAGKLRPGARGALYNEVQCIIGNGHMLKLL